MWHYVFLVVTLPFLLLPTLSQCQSTGCNYARQLNAVGESVLLQSPNYPGSYSDNVDCRYKLISPAGTRLTMTCNQFNLESSNNCVYDVFFLSPSGDDTFSDQEFFCGQGTLTRSSTSNRLAIGFHSDSSNPPSTASNPFRFQCQITVVAGNDSGSCSCGQSNNSGLQRIVGGSNAALGEFPWRVALYSPRLGVFCGGTIISPNFILTAAHCTAAIPPGETFYVDAGDLDLSSSSESQNQLISVDYIVQNSLYNDQTQDSDIALLRLQTPLTFNANVGPACLPWKYVNTDFSGQSVIASGWGTQSFGGGMSPVLKKVQMPVLETRPCADVYAGSSAVTVTRNMFCTYFPGRDTCQGDSGGSTDYRDPNTGRWYALGVTSQGIGCGQANQPGVYTKIVNYLQWIQGNTGETFCKA